MAVGYPLSYESVKNKQIFGLKELIRSSEVKLYGAGVKIQNNQFLAHGGRLFYLMSSGKDIIDARQSVYKNLSTVSIDGNNLHYRTDIGWRDLQRLRLNERIIDIIHS